MHKLCVLVIRLERLCKGTKDKRAPSAFFLLRHTFRDAEFLRSHHKLCGEQTVKMRQRSWQHCLTIQEKAKHNALPSVIRGRN